MLAESGASREWLYVALSRGRQANRLYVADVDRSRDEFAPVDPRRRDALRRFATGLARTEAQPMAIDIAAEQRRRRRDELEQRIADRQARRDRDDDFGLER